MYVIRYLTRPLEGILQLANVLMLSILYSL